mgnify:CR=1 FL=1
MTLIRQYVNAMQAGDSVALSRIFSPDAIFVDYCPKDAGQAQISAYGRRPLICSSATGLFSAGSKFSTR